MFTYLHKYMTVYSTAEVLSGYLFQLVAQQLPMHLALDLPFSETAHGTAFAWSSIVL